MLGVIGNVSRLGMLEEQGLGGVLGFDGSDVLTGKTCTNFGCFCSPGRILGSRVVFGLAEGCDTGLPFASNPIIFGRGTGGSVSSGSSGMHSPSFMAVVEQVGFMVGLHSVLDGFGVTRLFDMGEGGLRGRLALLIHFRVYFGAWAAGMGISPIVVPCGALLPLITRNWTWSL